MIEFSSDMDRSLVSAAGFCHPTYLIPALRVKKKKHKDDYYGAAVNHWQGVCEGRAVGYSLVYSQHLGVEKLLLLF